MRYDTNAARMGVSLLTGTLLLAALTALVGCQPPGGENRLSIATGGSGGVYYVYSRGASGIMTGFAYPEVLVETYRLFSAGEREEAQRHFFEHLPLIRFEAQLGVGGVGIRKEELDLIH